MPKRSAGLLMYRGHNSQLEVLLVHPGGPFWAKKNFGAWSIPKGECAEGENAMEAALREFKEETGFTATGELKELGELRQAGGKLVSAWAFAGDCDPAHLVSNRCQIEWPPRTGRKIEIPEVDRADWFPIASAREHMMKSQHPFLDRLQEHLRATSP